MDPDEQRRAVVAPAGAATTPITAHSVPPGPVDVAIVAVGSPAAYVEAFATLAPRGRLVVFSGLLPADDAGIPGGLNGIHYHEHTAVGSYGCSYRHGVEALGLLAGGRLCVDDLVTHRLPLAELERGLDIVARRAGMKVHLYPAAVPVPCPTEGSP